MNILTDKKFIWFLAKFLLLFGLFYFGTLAMIGLAAPGGSYSPFVQQYLDYVSWIKHSILWAVGIIASWAGYETYTLPDYVIRIKNGAAIKVAMSCVGYGVYSFWSAYVIANDGSWKKKILWIAGGLLLLWIINVTRISLFLLSLQKGKALPFGIDHHTWFSILAYAAIFGMIILFEKRKV